MGTAEDLSAERGRCSLSIKVSELGSFCCGELCMAERP